MRLLLATGHTLLDETLKKYLKTTDIQVVGECYSRIVLNKVARELQADTVIISGLLEDDTNLVETVVSLRSDGIRVIVLPGPPDIEETKELIINLVPYGVYDYVYDEVSTEDIYYRLKNPATLNDVPQELVNAAIEKQQIGEEINKKINMKLRTQENKQNREKRSDNKLLNFTVSKKSQTQNVLILATGDEDINEAISTSVPCETGVIYSRYELIEKITEINPAAVILSPSLPGDLDILEVAFQVAQATDKVLFISGTIPETDITVTRIKEFGIKVLPGDINIGTMLKAICGLLGNTIKECTLDYETEADEISEKPLFKIVKVGSEITKNLPSIHVPKIQFKKKKITYEKVIAVASPVPAGKTFVAVNLAVTLAQMGYRVCLIDGESLQQSTHTWLNGLPDEQGLIDALESDEPLMHASQLSMVPNLYILNKDPFTTTTVNLKSFTKMLAVVDSSDDVDVVIIDTHRNIAELLTKTVIETASTVILVADQDFSHLMKIQADLDKQENFLDFNKCFLLVNRVVDSQNLEISDAEKAAGLQADGIIPEKTKEVLESIKTGIPAALFCPDIRGAFEEFWNRTENHISSEVS